MLCFFPRISLNIPTPVHQTKSLSLTHLYPLFSFFLSFFYRSLSFLFLNNNNNLIATLYLVLLYIPSDGIYVHHWAQSCIFSVAVVAINIERSATNSMRLIYFLIATRALDSRDIIYLKKKKREKRSGRWWKGLLVHDQIVLIYLDNDPWNMGTPFFSFFCPYFHFLFCVSCPIVLCLFIFSVGLSSFCICLHIYTHMHN